MGESVGFEVRDGVAHVTLSQPDRGNPFDQPFCDELAAASTECQIDRRVRAVLIRAEGRFFTVGGDLRTLGSSREGLQRFIQDGTAGLHQAVSRFARCDAPVVIAVHAMCAGGGVSLAASADFCLAGRSAGFYAAYPGVGLAIDGGGSYFLPRCVGHRNATSFYLRNEKWTVDEAYDKGLVTRIVEDDVLQEEALALAEELAAGPTISYGQVKQLLLSTTDQSLDGQLEAEARAMAVTVRTEDTWNAITSAAAKQKPTFENH